MLAICIKERDRELVKAGVLEHLWSDRLKNSLQVALRAQGSGDGHEDGQLLCFAFCYIAGLPLLLIELGVFQGNSRLPGKGLQYLQILLREWVSIT